MEVKVGTVKFGTVVGMSEYGLIIDVEDETVYARATEEMEVFEQVMITFKSFGVGCYWEAAKLEM